MILGKSLRMAFRSNKKEQQNDSNFQQASCFEMSPNFSKNIPAATAPLPNIKPYVAPFDASIGIPVLPSSDESNSPTQMNQFKRIAEKPSLMKRIGKGFVLNGSDEEGYPLVSEGGSSIPDSQSNISLLNNELHQPGSSSEAATMRIGEGASRNQQPKTAESEVSFQYNDSISSFETRDNIRTDTNILHRRENNLRMAPWYQEGIPREIALEILSQEPIGAFMVRRSTTKIGCFALSVRVPRSFQPRGIAHYLIMKTNRGYRIKGFTKDFPSLGSLIAHHSVMPELLPCPLSLSRYHPICVISDCRRDFADIEPEPDG
ncbi:EGFR adapter protein-like isoform X2 [Anthonomus grandis grandis]|nr:EGFR adapter protein-like isoform X2 [Anthonomus grandis grandis]XP_050295064.1 EGFR adapter protein-like isoform X2 [Anthonomus grandis grandis]